MHARSLRRPFTDVRGHAVLTTALRSSPFVLDLGANRGEFSRTMNSAFGGTYLLVEANPELISLMSSEYDVVHCAVAAQSGTVRLNVARNDEGSSILTLPDVSPWDCVSTGSVDIPALTLDDILARWGPGAVDLVKMDIEGAEVAVLSTVAEATLRRIGQISVEFHSAPEFGFDLARDVEAVLRRMRRIGFLSLDFSRGRRENVLLINRRMLDVDHLDALALRAWSVRLGRRPPWLS